MNKKIGIVLVILIITPFCTNFAQKYKDGLVDKVVAIVGGEMITLSQVESEVQMMELQGYRANKNLRCEVLERMMVSKLYLRQARLDSVEVNPAMVESQLQQQMTQIISQLGGEKATEKYFSKNIIKLKKEWRKAIEEQSKASKIQQTVIGDLSEITPETVGDYFKEIPKDSLPIISTQYKMRQVVLYPDQEAAKMEVKKQLLFYRKRILDGENFAMLATLYSEDSGSAMKGGELGMLSKNVFWPAFSDAASSLKVGQISPIVETPDGFHIIQLIAREGDMINVRHILIHPKYTEKNKKIAFRRLDSIRNNILADSISFGLAARMLSEDKQTRTNDGMLSDPTTGSILFEKDKLKPTDYAIIKDMKIGDISKPFQSLDNEGRSGNTIYKIIKLEEIIPAHSAIYQKDFNIVKRLASNERSKKAIEKFIEESIVKTYIVIDPIFKGCKFKRDGWLK
ncbi:MAG: peptidylprolyl isomerase [Bacteroidales bacterium]